VNPAFERVTGFTLSEVAGQNPRILKSGKQDEAFYREMWTTLSRGEVWTGRMVNQRKDGSLFEEDATIAPVRDSTGRVTNYVAVKRDISAERRLEEQLLQAQKMEAIGRLAGGVAHDFNNLLGVIIGYGELVHRQVKDAGVLGERVGQILKAAERAALLTRQLLAFSRQQVLEPRILDLNAVIAELEPMLQRLLGEDIALATVFGRDLGNVRADPGQLGQIVMNLAVNARDAMPEGGSLTIETADADLDRSFALIHPPIAPGRYVRLAVSDTGCGMDAETQAHLFEPFFTTKEAGRGTGLGLSTVYGIVKQSEGFIWVYSEQSIGTTFKIYLPVVGGLSAPEEQAPRAALRGGTETVLLVEDEDLLAELLTESLESHGYTVLQARQGVEAVAIAQDYPGNIDLMVTDVILPGLTGRATAERIAPLRPRMKVLYISGYTDDVITRHGILDAGTAFLGKPFAPEALLRKIRDVLEG